MNNAIEKELLETGVLVLRLNRPEVLNAMNRDLIVGLLNTINETIDDEKVRSIVLTGNGKNMETAFNPLVKAITQSGKPIVTAINGIAAGGGVGLALSGDIVIAAKSAKFKLVFGPNLGIISDVGSSWFVPNLIGRARANGMGLLGEDISAEQAKNWGLIWDFVEDDDLLSKSLEIAERLANGPIDGLKAIVKAHDNALSTSLNEQLDYERDAQEVLLDKKEFKEGVSAFVGKRKPNFRDLS